MDSIKENVVKLGQKTFEDLVDFVVARILDQLNIEQGLMDPYQG